MDEFSALITWIRLEGRSCLEVRCRPRRQRVPGSNPDSIEDPSCIGPVERQIIRRCKRPPIGVALKFGEGVPAQMSSSSSNRDSKLRGPSPNSCRVSSKRGSNITKTKALN
ncbi:hypothetical protein AVEN_241482-1 [Araneus ventricosus]|uniref:Uncharacterized protein n=1 Tax=Araneus ventricosus TaxID=182803 RepID=A0A4Y2FIK1_ARAVE|nr:hypothetical protein AVEN_241482-1 [Araneus ventricosus]